MLFFVICTAVFLTNLKKSDHGYPVHKKGSSFNLGIVAMVLCVLDVGVMVWYKQAAKITNQQLFPQCIERCLRPRPRPQTIKEGNGGEVIVIVPANFSDNRSEQRNVTRDSSTESDQLLGSNPVRGYGGDGPVEDNLMGNNPVGDNPVGGKPVEDNIEEENLLGDNPVGDNPVEDNTEEDNAVGDNPVRDSPENSNPVRDNPVGDNPAGVNTV